MNNFFSNGYILSNFFQKNQFLSKIILMKLMVKNFFIFILILRADEYFKLLVTHKMSLLSSALIHVNLFVGEY